MSQDTRKTRIAINGFGRIGRLALRNALKRDDMVVVAINDLTDNEALAYLFKRDSVHGRFDGDVSFSDDTLTVNGHTIRMSSERDPLKCGWGDQDIDIVLECTGVFTKAERAKLHLDGGAKRVLISAPAKGEDVTVVLGVNHEDYDPSQHKIISNASCTTNCVAPVLKVLDDAFTISHGVLNTVHAYTNAQAVLDTPKSKLRRGRAAAVNLVPTSTGAAKAVGVVLPQLAGKLDGFAIRAPVPTGSLADLTLIFEKESSVDAAHAALKAFAEAHSEVMCVSDEELVSTDIVGDTHSCTVDSLMTMQMGPMLKLVVWYDNEAGYAQRLVDMAGYIGERQG